MLYAMEALLVFYISSFLHLHLLSPIAAKDTPPYIPTDYFLIDCGSSTNTTSMDERYWQGDVVTKFLPSNSKTVSSASFASEQDPSVPQIPYMTARISHSKFTYSFPVSPGSKFVRLYFYPASYLGLDKSKSFFSTKSGGFTLLSNFSAFLTISAMEPPQMSLVKEFLITVRDSEELNLTFFPSKGSYAFINGIEVVSMPYDLYQRRDDNPVPIVSQTQFFYFDNNTALEKMYRLNVGGSNIAVDQDTGMFRSWKNDEQYIYGAAVGLISHKNITIQYNPKTPAYTAPILVYSTSRTMGRYPEINLNYNLTWIFPVDSGFFYLFRLHFCEYFSEVTKENQRVFQIFINNQTAESEADVIHWSGGNGIPIFKDYVVLVSTVPDGSPEKQDIWLELHPNMISKSDYADAILNGLEIFKLNQSNGNLAGPNPIPVMLHAPIPSVSHGPNSKGSLPLFKVIVGTMISGIVVVFVSCFTWKRLLLSPRQSKKSTQTKSSFLPTELCRHFVFAEIEAATNNFDDCLVIGDGGFGKVYKGYMYGGHVAVAVKRLKAKSQQGAREFWTEIEMLSQLRYIHLVSLIGYCNDEPEMILVYDYMANGTLRDHLYGKNNNNSPLSWNQRLHICIGGGRGLDYLHTGAVHRIIHRDVKTTNILLDEKWVAKVSDFGLSKLSPISTSTDPISTEVKGTFGYMDPEYFRRQQVTEKSDVYSFGVVLLEVLCARPAVNLKEEEEKMSLANWASACIREGEVDEIMDPYLRGKIAPKCLRLFVEIAESCLHDRGSQRPTMAHVVASLECALQLQESADDEENVKAGDGSELVARYFWALSAADHPE